MSDSPYVADPANPTDAELAAAIERGLADGSLITAEDFLARVREDDMPAEVGVEDIAPATDRVYRIGSRWYWVTEITDRLASGSIFVMTVPQAKDPRYAQIGYGKLRYVMHGDRMAVRARTAPEWAWVTKRIIAES